MKPNTRAQPNTEVSMMRGTDSREGKLSDTMIDLLSSRQAYMTDDLVIVQQTSVLQKERYPH